MLAFVYFYNHMEMATKLSAKSVVITSDLYMS